MPTSSLRYVVGKSELHSFLIRILNLCGPQMFLKYLVLNLRFLKNYTKVLIS